jgi:hypothetical protein
VAAIVAVHNTADSSAFVLSVSCRDQSTSTFKLGGLKESVFRYVRRPEDGDTIINIKVCPAAGGTPSSLQKNGMSGWVVGALAETRRAVSACIACLQLHSISLTLAGALVGGRVGHVVAHVLPQLTSCCCC